MNWIATKWSWCIFQLAAMIGLRSVGHQLRSVPSGRRRCVAESVEAGEIALLDELERRAAAGAHVVDAVGEPELADRRGAVAARR